MIQFKRGRGVRFLACNLSCATAYREAHSIGSPVYGTVETLKGEIVSWDTASIADNFCAHCGYTPPVRKGKAA